MATIKELHIGFGAVWLGLDLVTLEGTVPVPVLLDWPNTEVSPQQKYPATSVMLAGLEHNTAYEEGDKSEDTGYNDAETPHEITTTEVPAPYLVSFDVHTFCLDAAADRDFMQFIETRLLPRDAFQINGTTYRVFKGTQTITSEVDNQTLIYHNIRRFDIPARLQKPGTETTTKVVHEVRIDDYFVHARLNGDRLVPVDENGNFTTAENARKTLHRTAVFDDTNVWFPTN